MIKGSIRITFFYIEGKSLDQSLDLLKFEFFNFKFNPSDEDNKIVLDHISSDNYYFLHEILKTKKTYKTGIYEIIGIYKNIYVEEHKYYDSVGYLDWEVSKIKLLRYNKFFTLSVLENIYTADNPYLALYLVESLKLSKYLNKNRKMDCSIKSNSLFKD